MKQDNCFDKTTQTYTRNILLEKRLHLKACEIIFLTEPCRKTAEIFVLKILLNR